MRPSVSCHVCVLAVHMTGAGVLHAAASARAKAAASCAQRRMAGPLLLGEPFGIASGRGGVKLSQ